MIFVCPIQSFFIIYTMFHEATACHVTGDLIDVLQLIHALLVAAKDGERKGAHHFKIFLHIFVLSSAILCDPNANKCS